jgi:hypothetical protein
MLLRNDRGHGPQFVELETPNVVAFISRNSAEPPGLSKILGAARSVGAAEVTKL